MNSIKLTNECIIELEKNSRLRLSENSREKIITDMQGILDLCSVLYKYDASELSISDSASAEALRADEAQPFKNVLGEALALGEYSVPLSKEGADND